MMTEKDKQEIEEMIKKQLSENSSDDSGCLTILLMFLFLSVFMGC